MNWPDDFINKIICGDCLEVMKQIPDKSIDLVLTDPPYGINAHILQPPSDSYRKKTHRSPSKRLNSVGGKLKNRLLNKSNCDWDCKIPDEQCFNLLFKISKNQVIWGGNYFPLPPTRGIIAWDKQQPWDNFSQFELGWTSFDFPAKLFRFNKSFIVDKQHPTQKPLELMKWCILNCSKENDLIFDPFLGSGTTAVACKELNRRYIGIEISPEYCAIANDRLKQEVLPL